MPTWFLIVSIISLVFILATYFYLKQHKFWSSIKFLFFTGLLIGFVLFFKYFIGGIYFVPSSSMEDTLFTGDYIFVDKLTYGPLVSNHILLNTIDGKTKAMENDSFSSFRLNGYKNIEGNEVILFELRKNYFAVKRCIGVPGDLIQMINGEVYINNQSEDDIALVKKKYQVVINVSITDIRKKIDSVKLGNIPMDVVLDSINTYSMILSKKQKRILESFSEIKSIKKSKEGFGFQNKLFTNLYNDKWDRDNIGPFKVPKKDMTVFLDSITFPLYHEVIEKYEKVDVHKNDEAFYTDGREIEEYTFRNNYYFVLGDNRANSRDSRYFGFVPENNIIGKVRFVIFSYNSKFIDWERFFKRIKR